MQDVKGYLVQALIFGDRGKIDEKRLQWIPRPKRGSCTERDELYVEIHRRTIL